MKTITWKQAQRLIKLAHEFSIANSDCEGLTLVNVDIDDSSYCITWQEDTSDFIIVINESENKSVQIIPEEAKIILIDNEGDPVELILYTRKIMNII